MVGGGVCGSLMEGRGSAGEEGPGQALVWARAPRLVLMTPWQSWWRRGVDTGKRSGLTAGGADGRMAPGGQGIEEGVRGVGGARDPRQTTVVSGVGGPQNPQRCLCHQAPPWRGGWRLQMVVRDTGSTPVSSASGHAYPGTIPDPGSCPAHSLGEAGRQPHMRAFLERKGMKADHRFPEVSWGPDGPGRRPALPLLW